MLEYAGRLKPCPSAVGHGKAVIDLLAGLVHPRDGHPKVLAVIQGYIDETGIHQGSKLCVICGFFGGQGQWRRFEQDWLKALVRYNVPLEKFHALDLINRRKFFFQWSDDQYNGLMALLIRAVTAYKIHPVTNAIDVDAFNSFPEINRRFFTGAELRDGRLRSSGCPNRPYFVPFQKCVKRIASYAPIGGRAHFFCGLDSVFGKYATSLYRILRTAKTLDSEFKDRLGDIAFPLAKETPQLQAADLLTYLTFQELEENINCVPQGWRKELLAKTRMAGDHSVWNKAALTESIRQTHEAFGNWERSGVKGFDHEDEQDLPD